MSNILDYQVSRAKPSVVGGVGGNVIKYFPNPSLAKNYLAPVIRLDSQNFQAPVTFPNATTVGSSTGNPTGSLFIPVGNSFDGQMLDVVCCGTWGADTGDPSATVNFQLQAVTGTFTNPVYTTVCSSGTLSPNYPGPAPWAILANLLADGNSGLLQGAYEVHAQGTLAKGRTVVDTVITGLDFTVGNPSLMRGAVLGFVVGVTFGTSDKSNTASLFEFTIES